MIRGAALALLVSTMPIAALTGALSRRAERAFFDAGAALGRGMSSVAERAPAVRDPVAAPTPPSLPGLARALPAASEPAKRARSGRKSPPVRELVVHVGEQKLLELARLGFIPSGQSVPSKGARPPGILLSGVATLGVGLRDGDVLTAVEGRPVQAEGQVIAVVIGVLARHARRITGEFWRDERRGSIVVDLPIVRMAP